MIWLSCLLIGLTIGEFGPSVRETVDALITARYWASEKDDGSRGASVQKMPDNSDGWFASEDADLIGKVGPLIEEYAPEADNRLIQEY